jgi:uncharacterized membrane protein YczE
MSRHSALSAVQSITTKAPPSVAVQVLSLIVGSSLIGIAVALLVEARLGLAPYDVLSSGISQRVGLSLGQASWLIAAGLTLVAIVLGRRPSRWGIAYVFLNGVAIDAASGILQEPSSMSLRIGFVLAGIVTMAAGINVVLHSGTTGGPFELLTAAGEDRGVSAVKVRYGLDAGVLVSGVALGGSFGPATVAYGALMGVTIMTGNQALVDHRRGRAMRSKDEMRSAREARRSGLRIIDSRQTSAAIECDRPKAPAMRRPIMQVASSTRTTTQLRAAVVPQRATPPHPPHPPRPPQTPGS